MIFHVLPGDSLVEEFKKTGIDGEIVVFRDAMIAGPIDAETPFEFWDQRARFVLAEYFEDEIDYHERVADEIERLSSVEAEDEILLWFEYELFCSVNMWFCISLLADSGASIYRVEPIVLSKANKWKGFGQLGPDELQRCYEAKQLLTDADIKLGTDLWNAYRTQDHAQLLVLANSATPRFPYLVDVCKAAIEQDTMPKRILSEIVAEGIGEFDQIFPEFTRRAGVYGFGDLQVERLLDKLSH